MNWTVDKRFFSKVGLIFIIFGVGGVMSNNRLEFSSVLIFIGAVLFLIPDNQ